MRQDNMVDRIINRTKELITEGERVVSTKQDLHEADYTYLDAVDRALFTKWKVNSTSFLKQVLGGGSVHFQEFTKVCDRPEYSHSIKGLAVLKAAREDIEGGYLKKLENLVTADVFDDFLTMAQYLLDQGFKDPAASLIGAVLEDGLRRIARNKNISVAAKDNIKSLNDKISQAQVYNRLVFKNVQVWNEIRDNADHGKFTEYKKSDIAEMLNGVTSFLKDYLNS